MAGHLPQLDAAALRRLRQTVSDLRKSRGPLPIQRLLSMAPCSAADLGFTIDFEATAELGEPLIVVRVAQPIAPDPRLKTLTAREFEIATLVAQGLSNKLIAAHLSIATSTVKDHVHRILEKTGLGNRAAVAAACRSAMSNG
jgi:DNA-binding CsgD family transcriptional regulator